MATKKTVVVKYGAKTGMLYGRFGIIIDGHQASYRTFKTKAMAEKKALALAKAVHKDFYQSINDTNYHFKFVLNEGR